MSLLSAQQLLNRHKQQGFTLIELLVASSLSLIIILAMGGAYLKTQQLNVANVRKVTSQQEARTTLNMVAYSIRNAGSYGCYSYNDADINNRLSVDDKIKNSLLSPVTKSFFLGDANKSYNNVRMLTKAQLIEKFGEETMKAKFSDIGDAAFAVQGAYSNNYDPVSSSYASWKSTDQSIKADIQRHAWVVVSDCQKAVVMPQEGAADGKTGTNKGSFVNCANNANNAVCFNMGTTTVRTYNEYVYFVGTQIATGRTGLFRLELMTEKADVAAFDLDKPDFLIDAGTGTVAMTVEADYLAPTKPDEMATACEAKIEDVVISDEKGTQGKKENQGEKETQVVQKTKLQTLKPTASISKTLTTPVSFKTTITITNEAGKETKFPIVTTVRGANICANEPNISKL